MDEKAFKFHGLDSTLIVVGLVLVLLILFGGMLGLGFLFRLPRPELAFFIAAAAAFLFAKLYGRYFRRLWEVTVTGKTVRVRFGGELKSQFSFDELKKIHISGVYKYDNRSSHRLLRLVTEQDKLVILIGKTTLVNTCSKQEMIIFDDFFSILEAYAVNNKYSKRNLKKETFRSAAVRNVKNYYYLKT